MATVAMKISINVLQGVKSDALLMLPGEVIMIRFMIADADGT